MEVQNTQNRFNQAVSSLSPKLKSLLLGIPNSAKLTVFEVRLRVGKPIMLTCAERSWFVDDRSQLLNLPKNPYITTQNDIADSVVSMCSHSIHSHQHEFKDGYISLRGGHRAGICGTAVMSNCKISTVRDITSVNLRIAREITGAADALIELIFLNNICGVLIAGIPSSGKTTVLRDLARQLASGKTGRFIKVAVVDERCELGAVYDGVPQNDLGHSSDILSGYPKAEGIMTAVRTLSPQVIVCDEIGGSSESDGIIEGLNSGVKVIATAHAGTIAEILRRPQIMRLLESGAFEKIVRLSSAQSPGKIRQIVEVGELFAKNRRNGAYSSLLFDDGDFESFGTFRSSHNA